MKKVMIIYRFLPQYRVDFYNGLREALAAEGVELSLVYGKSTDEKSLKNDEVDLPWAHYVPHKIWNIVGIDFVWQPYLKQVRGQDMVIVEQANKLLINYLLIWYRRQWGFKLAFWGHGRNLQLPAKQFANRFKEMFLKSCDWWFPYTEGVKRYITTHGFPAERITVVQNAIDTRGLAAAYDALAEADVQSLKQSLGIESENIGIYCGGIYAEKRIDFLIQACDAIRAQVPDFNMLFIGSGADAAKVSQASQTRPWIHYLGSKFGDERVPYFKMSSVFLMPGLVGLAILDCFATQTPMITTEYEFHSPEIEYLRQGENGIITPNTLEAYTRAVVEVLQSPPLLQRLRQGCYADRDSYNNETMVRNFKTGILACLARARKA